MKEELEEEEKEEKEEREEKEEKEKEEEEEEKRAMGGWCSFCQSSPRCKNSLVRFLLSNIQIYSFSSYKKYSEEIHVMGLWTSAEFLHSCFMTFSSTCFLSGLCCARQSSSET